MQSRYRILVIDDDPMYRNLIVSLLRKDYMVSVAADGESGFAKAQQHHPDLVIIDYQMPGWDGVQTLKAFRNDPQLKSTKTVMLTSDASKETVLAAIQAGTDNYTIKTTLNKKVFLKKIQGLLCSEIARPVIVASTATSQASAKTQPADQIPNGEELQVSNSQTSVEADEASSDDATTVDDRQLEKEMLEFQKSLKQNSMPVVQDTELAEESAEEISAPVQESDFEEELLEEVMDGWD